MSAAQLPLKRVRAHTRADKRLMFLWVKGGWSRQSQFYGKAVENVLLQGTFLGPLGKLHGNLEYAIHLCVAVSRMLH